MIKNNLILLFVAISCNFSCYQSESNRNDKVEIKNSYDSSIQKDKQEIQKLIQQVLLWGQSKKSIMLLPTLTDISDSVYIGFELEALKKNTQILKQTGFFSNVFIENYYNIITTLNSKLKNKEFSEWLVGDLPPFKFANGTSPWCLCQGFTVEQFGNIEILNFDKNSIDLIWHWKKNTDWKDFKFKVVKEDMKWKISFLEGFEFKEGIKSDGEI